MNYQPPPQWGPQQQWQGMQYGPRQLPAGAVICPNPMCGFVGYPRVQEVGGRSGCLTLILFCIGILPGILYIAFVRAQNHRYCQRCGLHMGVAP